MEREKVTRKPLKFFNWNETELSYPKKIFQPKSEEELRDILIDANKKKIPVRVVGPSRHTWGGLSMSKGYVINMRHFNKILKIDVNKKLLTVQGGCILYKINKELTKKGLSLKNMGGIDAQTIAGLAATGTHGSSINHGTISDDLESMRVMTSNGEIIKIKEGNEDFSSFKTSLGSLGIVLSVTIRCTKLFYINSKTSEAKISWKKLSEKKVHGLLHKNYFFQILIDPFTEEMLFTKRKKVEVSEISNFRRKITLPISSSLQIFKEVVSLYFTEYIILKILKYFPNTTEPILKLSTRMIKEETFDLGYRALTIGRNDVHGIYVNRTFHDQEYAIPIKNIQKALEIILRNFKSKKNLPLVIALRFVKKSDALLSPSYNRDTCYLDLLIFDKNFKKWEKFVQDVEKELYKYNARPHWGKHNFLSYPIIKQNKLYPKIDSFRKVKLKYDPYNIFSNDMIDECLQPLKKAYLN